MTQLKNNIIALCNQSGLTIEAVMYVLKDLYRDAEDAFLEFEQKKRKERQEKENKEKEEEQQEDSDEDN